VRVVVAPNSFRDCLDAPAVAASMARAVRRAAPRAEVAVVPLADGGDGTLAVLARLLAARLHSAPVHDPCGRLVQGRIALSADGATAVLEMAEASGLRLVPLPERDPFRLSSYGTGELIRAALDRGARRILLGAGGSGTIDGGAGALAALGAVFRDAAGRPLEPTPDCLTTLAAVDLGGLDPRLSRVTIEVLADIHTPIRRHVDLFGLQKGVRPETAERLRRLLRRLLELAPAAPAGLDEAPWMGAGGCLAGGLVAYAGARAAGGARVIAELAGLPAALAGADLLLTGEGRLDDTSREGKVPGVVAAMAAAQGVPTVVIAGQVAISPGSTVDGVVASFSTAPGPLDVAAALGSAEAQIGRTTEHVLRLFCAAKKGSP
jgi:glycerate 2-kinase